MTHEQISTQSRIAAFAERTARSVVTHAIEDRRYRSNGAKPGRVEFDLVGGYGLCVGWWTSEGDLVVDLKHDSAVIGGDERAICDGNLPLEKMVEIVLPIAAEFFRAREAGEY